MINSRYLIWLILIVGCLPSQQQPSEPVRPELAKLLRYYDQRYDPDAAMLKVEFRSPGYHSQLDSGTKVHPTRESLIYALALLQRDQSDDRRRAARIVRKVLSLQDRRPASKTYGAWPWHLQEPLEEMRSPDLNWADFCGMSVAHMLAKHADRMPSELRDSMRASLYHAARAIRRRDVGPGYTNIAILGGGVCAVAGELLQVEGLLKYGRRRLQKVVEHTQHHGSFSEYNSPPYIKVVIAECERTRQLVRDREVREAVESLRRTAWRIAGESFHPGTQQWAGPHARTSRIRLRVSTVDFLSRRLGTRIETHPAMRHGEPRGYAVVPPIPCPDGLRDKFRQPTQTTKQIERTFIRRQPAADSTIGTTWSSPDACLGTVNRSSLWTQRKPFIAYWKTNADPAVVFRLRFVHDGKDFASMGVRTVQQGPRALSVFHSLTNRGDWHRTLDRPDDGTFHAGDFRLRYELHGVRVGARRLGNEAFELSAGQRRIVIHAPPSHFAGHAVQWKLGREPQRVYLDAICYQGRRRAFDFTRPLKVRLAAAVELLDIDEPQASTRPKFTESERPRTTVIWTPKQQSLAVSAPLSD